MRFFLLTVFILSGVSTAHAEPISFSKQIRPIFSDRCYACHGPDAKTRKAGLRFDVETAAKAKNKESGNIAIIPGKPAASEILKRLTDPDQLMPPPESKLKMSKNEIALIRQWIAEGAKWERHWAFIPPVKSDLPKVQNAQWSRNEIDRFILHRLEAEKLQPTRPASKEHWLRRLTFDLTGLPPTLAELDAFLADNSARADGKVVDRLLKSPAFGERMALEWLDVVRYGDTDGLFEDHPRSLYPWRDWVVDAFNKNLPYSDFLTWQLAGDLLPNATFDQRIATGYIRNNPTSNEGGIIGEDYRIKYLIDRVNTTATAMLGLTLECAQCHDHKYDPIPQKDFYRLFAFFNQTADNDRPDEAPVLSLATEVELSRLDRLNERIADREQELQLMEEQLENGKLSSRKRTKVSEERDALAESVEAIREQKRGVEKDMPGIPIMKELPPDEQRETHVHVRGNFRKKGGLVEAGTPAVLHPFRPEWPGNRLGLAQWLVARDNPLTARVTVNRHWQQFFGMGFVRTSEEFGTQGELPSHPELLDWLAVDFMESGWSLKRLCKTIVMSATYRQSSVITPRSREEDPYNRLLARGPRSRLGAESIRDAALSVSGLLSEKMYGPSVMPYQPEGVWTIVYSSRKWETSENEDRYRRGLYTYWRRTSPYPSMMAFDAVSREVCTVRRVRTNTPLQALVLLNDPVYVEAAKALGRRVAFAELQGVEAKAAYGFRLALSRPPEQAELARLVALYEDELDRFRTDKEATVAMATDIIGPLWRGDFGEVAAWSTVASALLNLDEFVTKR